MARLAGPAPRKSKPKALLPIAAMRANTTRPRPTPTSQAPSARWRMDTGARNWCFMDLDQMSNSTA